MVLLVHWYGLEPAQPLAICFCLIRRLTGHLRLNRLSQDRDQQEFIGNDATAKGLVVQLLKPGKSS